MEEFMKDNIYFTSTYGNKYKQIMNLQNILNIWENKDFENELRCKIVELKKLTTQIKNLPNGLQVKIYIYALKEYLRYTFVPTTAKIPYHNEFSSYVMKEKNRVFVDNVHFLHMDFNTLPENKYTILGCQCDFCLKNTININEEIYKYRQIVSYFLKNVKCTGYLHDNEELNHWNHLYIYDFFEGQNVSYRRIFDPLYNNRTKHISKKLLTSPLIMDQLQFSHKTRIRYMKPPPVVPMKFVISSPDKVKKKNKRRKRKRN